MKFLLGGLERLAGLTYPALLPKLPVILKALYDLDIIDEDVILKWGERPSKRFVEKTLSKKIKEAAKPFLNWLEYYICDVYILGRRKRRIRLIINFNYIYLRLYVWIPPYIS